MVMFAVNYEMIPTIALTLNVVVTSLVVVNYWRHGHTDIRLILPFIVSSVPMAYLGGALSVSRPAFQWLLFVTLGFVAVRLYFWNDVRFRLQLKNPQILILSLVLGGVLGFVAGTVGIGGGIYLVPLIIMLGLASEKRAAAAGGSFVWINSVAGLLSRTQRGTFDAAIVLPLVGAVVVGGFVGSWKGAGLLKPKTIHRTLGVIVILAIIYLVRDMA